MPWHQYPNSLFGLGDTPIHPLGYIPLHTTFGKWARSWILSIDYIIVDVSSTYNAFLGQTTLNQLTAVVSTPHLCMKFPTAEGIATMKGEQKLARRCYNESLNQKCDPRGKEANTIELGGAQVREELRPHPKGETEDVQVGDTPDKTTSIGANLREDLKELLVRLLKENFDLFTWSAADMPGIDPSLMCHKLAVYPRSRPIQQKRRKLDPERLQVMEEQVQALLEASVDYTDLNKACPKDPYPLPSIGALVDVSSGYKYLSFIDAYLGYNQILMHKPDQEKTL
ncbi:uncharacterized protein [Arachis hypogaea]|uniref:uncharacterized protein n=1 Tax=Arachis hypogaea TaxID=3818 RepID=UPI003B21A22C